MAKNPTCELNINVWFWPWCVFVQGKLTASAVGQIVGLQSEEIKQIASEYAEKVRTISTLTVELFGFRSSFKIKTWNKTINTTQLLAFHSSPQL